MTSPSNQQIKKMVNFIWIGLFFSLVYWILESVRDVIAFEKGTLIERIFTPDSVSLWMRIVVLCIIMAFSAMVQSLRQKAEAEHKDLDFLGRSTIIFLSAGFGLIYWILEAIRDVVIYNRGTLMQQIFTPDPMGFWMRIFAICILILFGVYVKTLIDDRQKTRDTLKKMQGAQQNKFEQKMKELEEARIKYEKEIQSREWTEKELRELMHQKDSYIRLMHQSMRAHLQHLLSLLDLHIMKATEEEQKLAYTEVRTLIYSLILLHTHLHRSDRSNQINMTEYLEGLAEYCFHSHVTNEIKLHVASPHIMIPVSQAVPFAFVISEVLFLARKKRELFTDAEHFSVLVKRTDDNALSLKIRHKDAEILPNIENESVPAEYQWFRELIDAQLRGDFWAMRNSQGIELNIVFKLKI